MLFDTHAHLDFPDFANDLDGVLARAADSGLTRINTIGTTLEGSHRAVALAEKYPQVFAVVGVHPNAAIEAAANFITQLREVAKNPRVVAIGEAGLDYYRLPGKRGPGSDDPPAGDTAATDETIKEAQARVFRQQLDLAAELGLNIVIHERDAWDDTLAILRPYTGKLRAVYHCFGKSPAHARALLELGHMVSFTGIVTFKNAQEVQATAREIPAESFMFETDCPFLAPVPYRGKRCEPAHTRQVAEHVARLRDASFGDLAAQTSANACRFFRYAD